MSTLALLIDCKQIQCLGSDSKNLSKTENFGAATRNYLGKTISFFFFLFSFDCFFLTTIIFKKKLRNRRQIQIEDLLQIIMILE